ncbi:protein of unknown function [Petrocella atlantisensis]|uniref:Conjugal transfer protein n=1 Tax=Petrocella atlantisensis TaxID=2173034 RepID=A0A3P7PGZ8_9FIRM|nr:protein of unknown function [Petrocella atlantisensis]
MEVETIGLNKSTDKKKLMDQKMLDYCQELVILNYMYEQKMLTKEEMLAVKQTIKNSYNIFT